MSRTRQSLGTVTRTVATAAACALLAACSPGAPASPTGSAPTSTPLPQIGSPVAQGAPVAVAAPVTGAYRTGRGPMTIAFDDRSVWIENHRSDNVTRLDPETGTAEIVTDAPVHCSLATGHDTVWTTRASSGSVTRIDAATGEVTGTMTVPDACGLAVADDAVWVTSPGDGKLVEIDPETMEIRSQTAIPRGMFEARLDGDRLWITGEAKGGTLLRYEPATGTTTSIGLAGAGSLVLADGTAWIAAEELGRVYRVDQETLKIAADLAAPGIRGVTHDGAAILGTTWEGGIVRIDPTTNDITVVDSGFVELGPPAVGFGALWTGALSRDLVLRIDPALIDGR